MDLKTAKDLAIQRMNEWSNNGNLIDASKNTDYTLRMNGFANDCQNEISDKVGIDATYTINDSTTVDETSNGYRKYNLPTTFKEHRYVRWNEELFNDYRIENNQFIISDAYSGTFVLFHYKYPTEIDSSTPDAYVFEVDPYTHTIIPYYLGGMAIADENPMISDKLLNIYYDKLSKAHKRRVNYPNRVREKVRW